MRQVWAAQGGDPAQRERELQTAGDPQCDPSEVRAQHEPPEGAEGTATGGHRRPRDLRVVSQRVKAHTPAECGPQGQAASQPGGTSPAANTASPHLRRQRYKVLKVKKERKSPST